MNAPEPSFAHIVAMSDGIGTFEHADHSRAARRRGVLHRRHGPGARSPPAASRSPTAPSSGSPGWRTASSPTPRASTARSATGGRPAVAGAAGAVVEDCWGRAMWAFGTAVRTGAGGLDAPERGVVVRPRARAAVALATGDGVRRARRGRGARRPTRATSARAGCSPTPSTRSAGPAPTRRGRGPRRRLTYANAALAEALIAAGALLDRPDVLADGLAALRWLLDPRDASTATCRRPAPAAPARTTGRRCSTSSRSRSRRWPTPARAPTPSPAIRSGATASTLASSGSSAPTTSACPSATSTAAPATTASSVDGVNRNQGTESTLALITTLQHARAMAPVA